MSDSSPINLKEWIHIDSIESLLNNFNQRLTSQELKCAALQNLFQELTTKSSFDNFSRNIESELDGMAGLLYQLDRRTTIEREGQSIYCDELLSQHSEQLLTIEQKYDGLVSRNSFDTELGLLSDKISKDIQALKEQSASSDFTYRIAVYTVYTLIYWLVLLIHCM